jgi:hypothetical protein
MSGGQHNGLEAFRNAQSDAMTGNPLKTVPKYLYGVSRGNNVYWTGSMDLSVIKKVDGEFALSTDTFQFTVSGLENGDTCDFVKYVYNGSSWVAATGGDASGMLTANNGSITFILSHNQKIVISIPSGTIVTVSEANGDYIPSYRIGNGAETDGNTTAAITMDTDKTVEFTNVRRAVSPTGIRQITVPFMIILGLGIVMIPVVVFGRKRRREEE